MFSSDSATDPDVIREFCSYCEKQTANWCSECFGCSDCCPTGEHCDHCGQSRMVCDKTFCGGTLDAQQQQAARRIA